MIISPPTKAGIPRHARLIVTQVVLYLLLERFDLVFGRRNVAAAAAAVASRRAPQGDGIPALHHRTFQAQWSERVSLTSSNMIQGDFDQVRQALMTKDSSHLLSRSCQRSLRVLRQDGKKRLLQCPIYLIDLLSLRQFTFF